MTNNSQAIGALNDIGISINSANGELKPTGDLLDEIANKWKTLSDSEKQNLGVKGAGIYQLSRFNALMNNYSIAQEASETATNSFGSAMQEQEKYSESLQARINRLSNAFTSLAVSAGDALISDTLIIATEEFGNFLQTTGKIVDVIGVLPIVLGVAGTSVALLSKNVRGLAVALATGNVSMLGTRAAALGIEAGMSRATIATTLFKTAMRGLLISTGVGIALAALGFVVEKLANHFADAKQKQQEFEEIQNTTVESLTTNKEATDELLARYQELTEAKSKGSFSSEDEQEYLRVQQQLATLLPTMVDHYDSQGNAILKTGEALEQEIEYTKELVRQKKELQQLEAQDNISNAIKSAEKTEKQINKKDNLINSKIGVSNVGYSAKEKKQMEIEITELKREYNEQQMKLREELQKTVDSYFTDITIDKSITVKVNDIISSLDFSDASAEELNTFSKNVASAMKQMQNAATDNDADAYSKASDNLNELVSSFKTAEGSTTKRFALSLENVKDSINGVTDATDSQKVVWNENGEIVGDTTEAYETLSDKLSEAKGDFEAISKVVSEATKLKDYETAINGIMESYSALSDEVSPLNELIEKMAEGKSITANEAMELIAKEKDLASAISIENGQIKINEKAVLNLRDAKVSSYTDMINAQKREVQAQSEGLKTKLKNFGVEIKGILSVAQANEALAKAEEERARKMAGLNVDETGAMHASTVVQNQYEGITSGINDIKSAYEALDKMSDLASTGLTQVGTSAESSSESTEKSKYVTDKYSQSLEKLELALAEINKIKNDYPNSSKKYQDAIKQEIKLKEQQLKLMKSEESSLNKQIKSGNIIASGTSSTTYQSTGGSYSGQYSSYINQAAAKYSVDANLIAAIIKQESGFNAKATSSAGAQGLMQLMPGTARGLGVSNSYDPYENIMGGTKYIKQMLDANNGDLSLALASYNAGLGNVRKYGGIPPFAETQNYVQKVLANYNGSGGTATSTVTSSGNGDKQQAIDEAQSQANQIAQDALQLEQEIGQLRMDLISSVMAGFDKEKGDWEDDLAQIDLTQAFETETSKKWIDQQHEKEKILQKQIDIDKKAKKYLEDQIKNNKALTEAQKAQLSDDLLQRTQDMISLEQQLLDQRQQMADTIIDTYKQSLEAIKDARIGTIDKLIDEINKQADDESYAKDLADKQSERQKILDDIAKYSLDDSFAGIAKVKELQDQLAEMDESLSDMQSDREKELRIDNLNEQKDSIQSEFDNLVNDEQKFAQMRSDIINGNASQIQKDLDKYFTNIKANANVMGKALSNNLIDLINQANRYLNGKDYKPIKIASAKKGGITPSWGSNGKMMMVHEDEMISTKHDTKNLLSAMDMADSMASKIGQLANLDLGKLAMNTLTNFVRPNMPSFSPAVSTVGDTTYSMTIQNVTVTGDQKGADTLLDRVYKGFKSMGGK